MLRSPERRRPGPAWPGGALLVNKVRRARKTDRKGWGTLMDDDTDKAPGTHRKPLAELTDEELRVLANEATAVDEEVQELVRQVYRSVLEERALIRFYLGRTFLWGPAWLLPRLLESVAREARKRADEHAITSSQVSG
jgi:hypothetical protein